MESQRRSSGRQAIPAFLLSLLLGGCVSPLVLRDDAVAVGLYRLRTEEPAPDVRVRRVEGIGFLATANRVSLGFQRRVTIVGPLEGASWTVSIPEVEIMVGEDAIRGAERLVSDSAAPGERE